MENVRVASGSVSRFFCYMFNQITGIGDVPVAPSPSDANGRFQQPTGRHGKDEIQNDAIHHEAPVRE